MRNILNTQEPHIQKIILVTALGLWSAAMAIALFTASKLYSLTMLAATIFPLVLFTTGNPRLFFLIGMIFTAPLGLSINFYMKVHIGGAPSFSVDFMDFFLVPIVMYLIRDHIFYRQHNVRWSWISVWWICLMALGLWAVIVGPYRLFSAFETFRMFKNWLLFLVIINECVREKHFHYVLVALAGSVGLNVLIAAAQVIFGTDLGLQALGETSPEAIEGANYGVYLSHDSVFRAGALMGHPNLFGAYLAALLPIFISLLFTRYDERYKFVIYILVLAGLLALVQTFSRAAWVAFASAIVVFLVVLYFHPLLRERYTRLKGAMLLTMVFSGLLAARPIIKRLTASDSGAFDFRWEWMVVAWRMVEDKPILGFGLNTFSYHMYKYTDYAVGKLNDLFGETWPVVHNIYLLVWSEQGTVGLLLFLGLHVHIFAIAIRNARYYISDKLFMISLGAACGMTALMVDGLASFFPRVPASGRVYWIIIALIVAVSYWNNSNYGHRRNNDEVSVV